jgi:hypothetical protein
MRRVEERSLSSILRSKLLTTLINNDVSGKVNARGVARFLWTDLTRCSCVSRLHRPVSVGEQVPALPGNSCCAHCRLFTVIRAASCSYNRGHIRVCPIEEHEPGEAGTMESRGGREESKTADQEGQRQICPMKWRERVRFVFSQFSAAYNRQFPVC